MHKTPTHTPLSPALKQFIEASLQGHRVWNRNCYLIWLQVLSPLYWRATIIHLLPTCITQHRRTSLYWQMLLICLHFSGLKSCIKLYKKSIKVKTPVYSVTILIDIYIGTLSVRQTGTTMTLQLCSCRSGKNYLDRWTFEFSVPSSLFPILLNIKWYLYLCCCVLWHISLLSENMLLQDYITLTELIMWGNLSISGWDTVGLMGQFTNYFFAIFRNLDTMNTLYCAHLKTLFFHWLTFLKPSKSTK